MELTEIKAFLRIAEDGSFTRAAQNLQISQPAISRRIEVLEAELETVLFERLRTGAKLTSAGCVFRPFAERILADCRDAMAAVREFESGPAGSIALAIVGTLASTTLFAKVGSYRRRFPEVRLLIQTANSTAVSRLVANGEAQVGLRYFEDDSRALDSRPIAVERLVIACAHDFPLASLPVREGRELAGIPWVTFPAGAGSSGEPFARLLDHTLARLGLCDAERIVIDSLTSQKRLIEAGFGIGLIPASAIVEEVRVGSIRTIDVAGIDVRAPIHLVRRRGGYESRAMRELIDCLGIPAEP